MAMSTKNRSFPYEDDESAVTVKLYGRNTIPEISLNGWTHVHPHFGQLNIPEKCISEIKHEDLYEGDVKMITTFTKTRKIKEIEEIVNKMPYLYSIPVSFTLDVVVIDKIAVEIRVKEGKAILFGGIVVADLTDSCSVKFFGAGIGLIYEELDVGDRIFITAGTIKKLDAKPSLCIEIGEYKGKSIYKLTDMKYPISKYISSNTKLMTPSEIIKCWEGESSEESLMNARIDVIGVITHVSRFERVTKYKCPTAIVKPTGEVTESLKQFTCFCWIELIDENGATPLPVLVYINSKLWNLRQKILPGSIVVLTHVNFSISEVWMDYAKTTSSTSMFINNEIKEYQELVECHSKYSHETPFVDQLLKFSVHSGDIIQRCTMIWSVGGSYILPVKNDDEFLDLYNSKWESNNLWPCLPSLNLERRECETIIFEGYIIRYTFFDNELSYQSNEQWSWKRKTKGAFNPFPKRIRTNIDERTLVSESSVNWSIFSKKLPIFVEDVSNKNYVEAFETVSESTQKYSAAYQMPAGKLEEAQKLPFVDAFPHYILDIFNTSDKENDIHGLKRKLFIWKLSRNETIENMKKKLEACQNGNAIFIAKISRIETLSAHNKGYQLMLEDVIPMKD